MIAARDRRRSLQELGDRSAGTAVGGFHRKPRDAVGVQAGDSIQEAYRRTRLPTPHWAAKATGHCNVSLQPCQKVRSDRNSLCRPHPPTYIAYSGDTVRTRRHGLADAGSQAERRDKCEDQACVRELSPFRAWPCWFLPDAAATVHPHRSPRSRGPQRGAALRPRLSASR